MRILVFLLIVVDLCADVNGDAPLRQENPPQSIRSNLLHRPAIVSGNVFPSKLNNGKHDPNDVETRQIAREAMSLLASKVPRLRYNGEWSSTGPPGRRDESLGTLLREYEALRYEAQRIEAKLGSDTKSNQRKRKRKQKRREENNVGEKDTILFSHIEQSNGHRRKTVPPPSPRMLPTPPTRSPSSFSSTVPPFVRPSSTSLPLPSSPRYFSGLSSTVPPAAFPPSLNHSLPSPDLAAPSQPLNLRLSSLKSQIYVPETKKTLEKERKGLFPLLTTSTVPTSTYPLTTTASPIESTSTITSTSKSATSFPTNIPPSSLGNADSEGVVLERYSEWEIPARGNGSTPFFPVKYLVVDPNKKPGDPPLIVQLPQPFYEPFPLYSPFSFLRSLPSQ